LWLFMLCLVLVGALVVSAYTFMFPVKTLTVEGNSRYTTEEIIAASGIVAGDNLLALDPDEIENRVRLSCPYVHGVSLQRKLPTQVVLTVTEGAPELSFLMDGEYYLVNDRYELMELNAQPMGGTVVHGLTVTNNGVGKPVMLEPNEIKTLLDSLVNELTKQGITQITQIDLRDDNNIRMLFADRHIWELGNREKLSYKIEFGAQISKRETGTGVVNLVGLNTGKNGYFSQKVVGEFVPAEQVTPTDTGKLE
ncbi:MAG: FtsQ-type POTRA domain-containing protein, partial [Clostridia bacterium]|nr:FtsQ-type POTRA domain-containing protein [Clostridia bacterium]